MDKNNEMKEPPTLFDMTSVAQDSPRMAAIKAADIQTMYVPHADDPVPWMAIPMHEARAGLKACISEDEPFDSIDDITASMGISLRDLGMIFDGETEREAQDMALAWLARQTINEK